MTETPEYRAMMVRMLRAYGRRVADADDVDLGDMVGLRDELEAAIADAVRGQRERHGRSWADIGRALGITRQAAQQRYTDTPRDRTTAAPDPLQLTIPEAS